MQDAYAPSLSMIDKKTIEIVTTKLLKQAVNSLPDDVLVALKKVSETEDSGIAKNNLRQILGNAKLAASVRSPMCQDTGLLIFFIRMPRKGDLQDLSILMNGINSGVKIATRQVPLRPNAVHPITRKNPGDNVGIHVPVIHLELSDTDYFEITVMTKGAGSENMSALAMLSPSAGLRGIKEFVFDTVVKAGSKPCPPIIVGVGIGGTSDLALHLAKQALLRPVGTKNTDKQLSKLEQELLTAINRTGIGAMGLGGKVTAMAVHIEIAYCHTASLPVGICIQCWAARSASAWISKTGTVTYSR